MNIPQLKLRSRKTVRFSESDNIRVYFRAKWRLLFIYVILIAETLLLDVKVEIDLGKCNFFFGLKKFIRWISAQSLFIVYSVCRYGGYYLTVIIMAHEAKPNLPTSRTEKAIIKLANASGRNNYYLAIKPKKAAQILLLDHHYLLLIYSSSQSKCCIWISSVVGWY